MKCESFTSVFNNWPKLQGQWETWHCFFCQLSASACFKCHRYYSSLPSGSLHKWPCIPAVRNLNKTRLSREKNTTAFWFLHMLTWFSETTNMSPEQSMYYARLPWREHRAIRQPSGRHPVFTGKPLKPGLMHSKHTSLYKCGWWLSGPFPFSPSVLARHQWPFKWAKQWWWELFY